MRDWCVLTAHPAVSSGSDVRTGHQSCSGCGD